MANLLKSPWWLVRNDRIDEAKKVLTNLVAAKGTDYDVDRNIAMMIHTNAHEKAVSSGTSYRDCFTGVDMRRTEITCVVWILQITCGIWFGGNVTYFLEQAGMSVPLKTVRPHMLTHKYQASTLSTHLASTSESRELLC